MKALFAQSIMSLEKSIPELRERFPEIEFVYCPDESALSDAISDADIYVGGITREVFLAGQRLRWIQSPSSGVDRFLSIPELKAGDVLLTSASGTHGPALAESALGTILAFTRGLRASVFRQQQRKWVSGELRPNMIELTGKTLGIVGYGAFGQHLAERARPFGMRILAIDIEPLEQPPTVDALWGAERLDDLLRASDFVVIALPLTAQTDNLIDADKIALMKPSAMLLAMSRGGVVDQDALALALREKRLWAGCLEVTKPEPLPAESHLWDVDNLLITSHIAGGTQHERRYIIEIFSENLRRFLADDLPLRNQVDKQKGY